MSGTRKRAGAKSVAAMLKLLTTSGGSYEALRRVSGMSQEVVSAWIRELRRDEVRLVFIGHWLDDTRGIPTIPVFHWGPFPDVPRPKGKPAKVRVAEYRARKALKGTVT